MSKSKNLSRKMVMMLLSLLGTCGTTTLLNNQVTLASEENSNVQNVQAVELNKNNLKSVLKKWDGKEGLDISSFLLQDKWQLCNGDGNNYVKKGPLQVEKVGPKPSVDNATFVSSWSDILNSTDLQVRDITAMVTGPSKIKSDLNVTSCKNLYGDDTLMLADGQKLFILADKHVAYTVDHNDAKNLIDLLTYKQELTKIVKSTENAENPEPNLDTEVSGNEINDLNMVFFVPKTGKETLEHIKKLLIVENDEENLKFYKESVRPNGKASLIFDLGESFRVYRGETGTTTLSSLVDQLKNTAISRRSLDNLSYAEQLLVWGAIVRDAMVKKTYTKSNGWALNHPTGYTLAAKFGGDYAKVVQLLDAASEGKLAVETDATTEMVETLRSVFPEIILSYDKDDEKTVLGALGYKKLNEAAVELTGAGNLLKGLGKHLAADKKIAGKKNYHGALLANRRAKIGFGVTSGVLLAALAARDVTAQNSLIKKLTGLATQNKTSKMKTNNSLRNEKEQLKNMSK